MQLSEEQLVERALDELAGNPIGTRNIVETSVRIVLEALRAQADARPVAWCRRDTVKNWAGQLVNAAYMFPSPEGIKDAIPLYTHPEASAPGLSDEARKLIQYAAEFIGGAVNYGQNAPDEPPGPVSQWDYDAHYLAQGLQALLTRASAATAKE